MPRKYSGTCGPGHVGDDEVVHRAWRRSACCSRRRASRHRTPRARRTASSPAAGSRRSPNCVVWQRSSLRRSLSAVRPGPRCRCPAGRTCPTPGCGRADRTCRAPTPAPSRPASCPAARRGLQELAQHAGHQRHHHVVDLDAEVVLDLLDVVEVQLGERDVAVPGDVGVERGARRGERAAPSRARCGRGARCRPPRTPSSAAR